jgi:glycosyltransferase involved in cell wall biosynthesis
LRGCVLKITFVIPYFYPAWQYGGQPRSAYELARALVKRGHHVKVLTTDSAGQQRLLPGRRDVDGIEVIYYRNISNWLAFKKRIFGPMSMFREMKAQLAGSDILHIHELRSTLSVSAHAAAKALRIPYVLSTHGGLKHLGKHTAKKIFDTLWGMKILSEAAVVIAISPLEEQEVHALGRRPQRVAPLPNMVSASDYADLPAKGVFKEHWNLRDRRMILFLGRLHWIKGADILIKAFARIATPGAVLVIAGSDDGHETQLRALAKQLDIESAVVFSGFLDDKAKREALVDADILVIPSRSEVFAITAIEALMCGCPVLLSDVCGVYPLPEAAHGLELFRSENVEDLARKLAGVLSNPRLPAAACAGRDFVLREFNADTVVASAESIYQEALR